MINLLSVRAEVVVLGERIEPLRPALVFGQNRIGKFGDQIFAVRCGIAIVPGAGRVV